MRFFSFFVPAFLLCAGVSATNLSVAQVQTQERSVDRVLPRQVSGSAWYVEGESALGSAANRNFISNSGFVVTPAGVVVIDALGSPELARELMQAISRVTDKPVTHVIVTHYHADHIYGLQTFKEAGARIIAHRAALEYLNSDAAAMRLKASREQLFPWIDGKTHLVPADEWLDGPRELSLGGIRFILKPLGPAHTPEDLTVYIPSEKVLFAGDLVFRGRVPFVGQADSKKWIESLDAMLGLDAQIIVPGHGPASYSPREDLQQTRDYLAYLRETMGKASQNLEPFEEAYKATDWSRFESLPLFRAANRMNAYNTYLLMERE
jgi:glyoxylase-like metal-dependent hydrolase (beta-lactamase superfamily II)